MVSSVSIASSLLIVAGVLRSVENQINKYQGDEDFDDDIDRKFEYDRTERDGHGDLLKPPLKGINRLKDNKLRP